MSLREFVRPVQIVEPTTSAHAAAQQMREHHVGALVVVDADNRPMGVVTDRDLALGVLLSDRPVEEAIVGEYMTARPVSLPISASVVEAARTMRRKVVRRLPLTDADGVVVGIVTADDLLGVLANDLRWLAASTQVGIEAEAPFGEAVGSSIFGRE